MSCDQATNEKNGPFLLGVKCLLTLIGYLAWSIVEDLLRRLLNASSLVEEADSGVGYTVIATDGLLVPRLRATVVVTSANSGFRVGFLRSGHQRCSMRLGGLLVRCAKGSILAVVRVITEDWLDVCRLQEISCGQSAFYVK